MINDSYDCMKDAQLFLFYLSTSNLALKLYLLFPGIDVFHSNSTTSFYG